MIDEIDEIERTLPFSLTAEEMKRGRENTALLRDASLRLRVPRQQVPMKLAGMVKELEGLKAELRQL